MNVSSRYLSKRTNTSDFHGNEKSIILLYIVLYGVCLYLVGDGETTAAGRYGYMLAFPLVVFLQFHAQANTTCFPGESSNNFDRRNDTAIGTQDVGSLRDTHDCVCAHIASARHEFSFMHGGQGLLASMQR
jgi:hypothetical protein